MSTTSPNSPNPAHRPTSGHDSEIMWQPEQGDGAYPQPQHQSPFAEPGATVSEPAPVVERVNRGLIFSLAGMLLGLLIIAVVANFGRVGAIGPIVMELSMIAAYAFGAGTNARRGAGPLIVMIIVGLVAGFFAFLAGAAFGAYDKVASQLPGASQWDFVQFVVTHPGEGVSTADFTHDVILYVLAAAIGLFFALRNILRGRKG